RQAQAAAALRPDAVTADLPAGLIGHFFGLGDAIAEPAHEPRVGAEDRRRDHRLNHGRVAAPDVFHDHTTVDAELDRLPHRGILTELEPGRAANRHWLRTRGERRRRPAPHPIRAPAR